MTRLLCYIGFHRYATQFNDEGQGYLECRRCKKIKDYMGPGFGMTASGGGGF